MPSALKKPTLDELYRRLRDLDYTQVDERMAVMLNAILQLEEQERVPGVCDRSGFDGRLHHRWNIQSRANQVAVLERGWSNKGVRLGKEPWLE